MEPGGHKDEKLLVNNGEQSHSDTDHPEDYTLPMLTTSSVSLRIVLALQQLVTSFGSFSIVLAGQQLTTRVLVREGINYNV
jgi:hypothetical protein